MSKTSKIVILTVVLLVAVGAAVYVMVFDKKETPSTNNTATPAQNSGTNTSGQATQSTTTKPEQEAATLTYSNDGFSPVEITVKANETIKVVNQSSSTLDFSSDPHPTHTNNPELNVGDIAPGESATFTVSKAGTWGFHNHYAPNHHGSVIVE